MEIIKPGYTRVSEILESKTDFKEIPKQTLDAAKRRGEIIHNAIKAHWDGSFYPVGEYRGYFDSFLSWWHWTGFEPIETELRLYDDKLKITGKMDAFFRRGSNRIIVDWKAVSMFNKEYCELQGMFYHHLARINGLEPSDELLFVKLHPQGKIPQVFRFKASQTLWNKCLEERDKYFSSLNRKN